MVRRRTIISGALSAAAGLTVAGCSSSAKTAPVVAVKWAQPGTDPSSAGVTSSAAAATVSISPAAQAKNVALNEPIVVTATSGTIQTVSVTAAGHKIAGELSDDSLSWKSTGALGYGVTYTVTASVTGGVGDPVQKTSTFTTVKPASTAHVTFQANALVALRTGGTYGMGQPVIMRFSKKVTNKTAVQAAVKITTSPSVEGKFYWLDKQTLHWRPEKYWAKGTKITVDVNVLGVNLGGGVYGAANSSTHFSIGRQLLAVANNTSHYTQVYVDGKMVRNMACSMGKGGITTATDGSKVNYWTHTGPHVVLQRSTMVTMSSATYGITDVHDPNYYTESVPLATRISYSGEFLHAATWNMPDHGKRNTSHGCVNLSMADAQWVYDNFLIGDVVEVKNTPTPLPPGDGLTDWMTSWSSY
jgi:lipoprotein-anchoring transpeptidase ErfK/SrfK